MRWACSRCGATHDELPFNYAAPVPDLVLEIPPPERLKRVQSSSDQCIVDGHAFFLLGNLEIPVIGADHTFSWDCWVSLSEANFGRASDLWEAVGRESEPPYFGWLSTSLPGYPDTLNLKTLVHTRAVGLRPFVEVEPTSHPLAVEQGAGITIDRLKEIAHQVLHSGPGPAPN